MVQPQDWEWLGYREIIGQRQRYRLMDLERLCWRLRTDSVPELGKNLEAALRQPIAQGQLKREPCWSEGLAVGSAGFLEKIKPLILSRQETEVVPTEGEIWVLQESPVPHNPKRGLKNAAKAVK